MEDTEGPDGTRSAGDAESGPTPDEVLAEALDRLGAAVTEVAETLVGLGVLGLNRLQALRRDLAAQAERARTRPPPPSPDPTPAPDREPEPAPGPDGEDG